MSRRPPSTVQSLVFSRKKFTAASARAWAKRHGFRYGNIDPNPKTYRFRQVDPYVFREGSFRTITFAPGIKAVIGRLP